MAKSGNERAREFRERLKEQGRRKFVCHLNQDDAAFIEDMAKRGGPGVTSNKILEAMVSYYRELDSKGALTMIKPQAPVSFQANLFPEPVEPPKPDPVPEPVEDDLETAPEAPVEIPARGKRQRKTLSNLEKDLADLKTRLDAGPVSKELREEALTLFQTIRQVKGLSFAQLAKYLNDVGIPTFSGRGEWKPGTLQKMLT